MNSGNAAGLLGFGPDATEMKSMPDYCQANSEGQHSIKFKNWAERLGPQFYDFHHYCAGLNQMYRYQRLLTDSNRNYYLSRAVPEMNYAMDKLPPNFPLAGEMYLNRGLAKQLMRQNAAALTDFQKAINNNPKLTQAYISIAEFHEKANQKQKALDLISTGLREVPDSKALKRKYIKLGGKEPFPVQITETSKIEQKIVTEPSENIMAKEPTNSSTTAETVKAITKESNNSANDTKSIAPNETSSKNPYCRFCP